MTPAASGAQSSWPGRRRACLRRDWCRFESSRACLADRLGRVARLGFSTCNPWANRARRRSSASSRLRAWDRESDAVARATGPNFSNNLARWRGPSDGEVATGKRTSTRVSDVLAC